MGPILPFPYSGTVVSKVNRLSLAATEHLLAFPSVAILAQGGRPVGALGCRGTPQNFPLPPAALDKNFILSLGNLGIFSGGLCYFKVTLLMSYLISAINRMRGSRSAPVW